jgi:hypothetical protein
LYKQVVSKDEHPEGQGERLYPDLPIYANREARIFAYWDHLPRASWQTPEYYASQKKTLRPGTYLRLHENRWAAAEEIFITGEMWDPCVNQEHHPAPVTNEPLFCRNRRRHQRTTMRRAWRSGWDEAGENLILVSHRIWRPNKPLDIENTVEQDLRDLNDQADVVEYLADPYQMHRSITTLQAAGFGYNPLTYTLSNLRGQQGHRSRLRFQPTKCNRTGLCACACGFRDIRRFHKPKCPAVRFEYRQTAPESI